MRDFNYDPEEGFLEIDWSPTHAVVPCMGGGRDWHCYRCDRPIVKEYRTGQWQHAKVKNLDKEVDTTG